MMYTGSYICTSTECDKPTKTKYKVGDVVELNSEIPNGAKCKNFTIQHVYSVDGETYYFLCRKGQRTPSGGEGYDCDCSECRKVAPPLCGGYHWRIKDKNINRLVTENSKSKPMIKRLNMMMKKLLDADTKKLLKAGIINGDLNMTDLGHEIKNAVILEAYKAKFLEAADEIIAEEEKESSK